MNKKWLCGIAALGFMVSAATADDSYYLFKFEGIEAANTTNDWEGNIMGFKYGGATVNNPTAASSIDGNGIEVFSEGVAKIENGSWGTGYPGIFIGLKAESSSKKPSDCVNGISYWYKSNEDHTVVFQFPSSNCPSFGANEYGNQWKKPGIAAASSWTKNTVKLDDANANDDGGCGVTVSKDLAIVEQISWGFEGANSAKSGLNLMIANVACLAAGESMSDNSTDMPNSYTYVAPAGSESSSSSTPSPGSSSSGGSDPIISYKGTSVTGLNVVHFARSLQIASGKDATVSLFDMHGKQVFSQKVFGGTTTISLEKQRQGVYYAVVQSGSLKQTVKVVLK